MTIRKAIIPAAGLGTRFLPATKAMPKEMLPIIDKPTIQFIVEEAVSSGIEELIIVTREGKHAIEDHFDTDFELEHHLKEKGKLDLLSKIQEPSRLIDIHYIRQKEPRGLGHAIWCARKFIGHEPFAVLLGDTYLDADTPCLKQMIEYYNRYQASILGVQSVDRRAVSSYGIVEGMQLNESILQVTRLVEKPQPHESPSTMAMIGRYILTPAIFDILKYQKAGVGEEIQLTDAIATLNQEEPVYASQIRGVWHDVGDHMGYVKAILAYALKQKKLQQPLMDYLKSL
ncbi:UTP--glucose-1-phosphate uridylyltransferase GalU [Paenibacillus sp. GD4]|uniref:UTP--glucose-1-phosphate uridylyltransferase GalU n=1 Tax=Paenibacillus sp. GD4 TaxID=3068890 RepID=UPI002796BFAA|nr:UTP--glucose-1-phosphate uridylyltransferase GalU [Paenibacillus sp. GD4]MDQ1912290.1 UTP--glucose-1-phosphate uridylyltransferase GalU [Paenibacillus sp. GD4]